MNPSDLLASAERLAASGIARVEILSTKQIALLVPPGTSGKKLLLKIDGTGQEVTKLPTEVKLLPLPSPRKPKLALQPKCDNCSNPGKLKCPLCEAPPCSQECMNKTWKDHRPPLHGSSF